MTKEPTTGAVKAACKMWLDPRRWESFANRQDYINYKAAIIDRETGLPELVDVLKGMIANCDQCDEGVMEIERNQFTHGCNAYDGAGQVITDDVPCPYCRSARAALAKYEGKE